MANKIVKNFNFPDSTDTYQVNAEQLGGYSAASYARLSELPDVAKSGNYADLSGKPTFAYNPTTGELTITY